jgi:MEMO1 family protein
MAALGWKDEDSAPTHTFSLRLDRRAPDLTAQPRVRPPALAGRSYPSHPATLRDQLDRYFAHAHGSGPPRASAGKPVRPLRAIMCPHIDFGRGGTVYSWAYRELIESSDADVFVVLGVAHQFCRQRFVLTRQDFETPLGVVKTDRDYVDRLSASAGAHLFQDEPVHRGEHSIEFQTAFLQHLIGGRRPFQIVPILVGSFHDLLRAGVDPIDDPSVRAFINALKATEVESARKVAYIGAVDFCHVGPEFGDREPVSDAILNTLRAFDALLLDRAAAVDPAGWFATATAVGDRYRVCGLAATYTMLHAIGPAEGRVLKYGQAVDDRRTCCVTFASLGFDALEPHDSRTAARA